MNHKTEIKEVSTEQLGRIYHILYFVKRAKIAETVNKYIEKNRYRIETEKGKIEFSIGQIFEIIVINRLYGLKTPIYHIGEWYEGTALPEIYGIPSKLLNDDRIGKVLDEIYPMLSTIDSEITIKIMKEFSIDCNQIHFDASSYHVHGEYIPVAKEEAAINIIYGRDGKGRKDEKIVRFGIAISQDSSMPLLAKCYSGNTNDSEMHSFFISKLKEILSTSNFLLTADSKFDVKENFREIFSSKAFFVCPGAFLLHIKKDFLDKYKKSMSLKI